MFKFKNFVMKGSRKRPRQLLGLPNWTSFLCFLSDHFFEFLRCSLTRASTVIYPPHHVHHHHSKAVSQQI